MSGRPYTMKGEEIRLIAAGNPGQQLREIEFDQYGMVRKIEWYPKGSGSAEAGTSSPVGERSVGTRVPDPETAEERVAREDRAAEVRLRSEERVAELEHEANK